MSRAYLLGGGNRQKNAWLTGKLDIRRGIGDNVTPDAAHSGLYVTFSF